MIKNYSLKDAFKALDEINDELIETSIVINGPLNESFYDQPKEEHPKANVRVFDIDWELDDEVVDLPSEMFLQLSDEELNNEGFQLEEIIANKLSDETGWLVNYFDYEKLNNDGSVISESKEKLTEETFSLSDDEGLKGIEDFKKEEEQENKEPELTVVDTNADTIDDVVSNNDAAGSFVFTCDKCGENIFRTLDELKEVGYERIDDILFKLKNKDVNDGEFYHCTKCGNDTFTGNKQIVLADIDAEVEGKPAETENSIEDIEPAADNLPDMDNVDDDIIIEESLDNTLDESMKDKVVKTTQNFSKEHGQIICNNGEQEKEVVELLKANGYDIDVTDGKHGSVNIKYTKKTTESLDTEAPAEFEDDDFEDIAITDIAEESLDEAISQKLSEMYENFASYKTETAFLKDVENKIILEGNLKFNTNKEQHVKFILEAIDSENNNLKFKLTCEDFDDITAELDTVLNEGLLEAKKPSKSLNEEQNLSEDKKSLNEEDIYGLYVNKKEEPVEVGSKKEMFEKKKHLEEVAPEDSYHNLNKYYVRRIGATYWGTENSSLNEEDFEDKNPADCSKLEDYDSFGLSDLEYNIEHDDILEAENISEDDERDWAGDADGYVAEICSVAAWGGPTSNPDEKRLLVDYIARKYPGKLKVIRKYLGNDNSSVKLDYDTYLEGQEEK